jgi:hypothetical protein
VGVIQQVPSSIRQYLRILHFISDIQAIDDVISSFLGSCVTDVCDFPGTSYNSLSALCHAPQSGMD